MRAHSYIMVTHKPREEASEWNPPYSNLILDLPTFRNVKKINFYCLSCLNVNVKVTQSCPTLCDLMDYTVHGILQARILEWVAFPFSRGSSQPRDRTQVSCVAGGFFTSRATREALRIREWVACSFSKGIFPIQESNRSLLHCRRILYQLSYQGSPPFA